MKNFNPEEYRDNLAKDLKEIRKTDPERAQEVLGEARETSEYKYSKFHHIREKNLKNFSKEIRNAGRTDLPYFHKNEKLYALSASYRALSSFPKEYLELLKRYKGEFPKIDEVFDVAEENPETIEKINLAIDKLNTTLNNNDSSTFLEDLGDALNDLGVNFAFISSDVDMNGFYKERVYPWIDKYSTLEIESLKYFKDIEKEVLEKVLSIVKHATEIGNAVVHTHPIIKNKVMENLKSGEDGFNISYQIIDDSYFSIENGWLEELIKKNQIAIISNMQLAPGDDGYFAIDYYLKKDNTCDVESESTENYLKKELFEKFTAHNEPFQVKLDDVIGMLDNDKKVAQDLIVQAEKTNDEMGEIRNYEDFIDRINLK